MPSPILSAMSSTFPPNQFNFCIKVPPPVADLVGGCAAAFDCIMNQSSQLSLKTLRKELSRGTAGVLFQYSPILHRAGVQHRN